jgi:hypothetical protein
MMLLLMMMRMMIVIMMNNDDGLVMIFTEMISGIKTTIIRRDENMIMLLSVFLLMIG